MASLNAGRVGYRRWMNGWMHDKVVVLTLATVSDVKAAGEHVAGLVAELVGQPGVGTARIAGGHPAEPASELPDMSAGTSTSPRHVATAPGSTWWTEKEFTPSETAQRQFSLVIMKDEVLLPPFLPRQSPPSQSQAELLQALSQ